MHSLQIAGEGWEIQEHEYSISQGQITSIRRILMRIAVSLGQRGRSLQRHLKKLRVNHSRFIKLAVKFLKTTICLVQELKKLFMP